MIHSYLTHLKIRNLLTAVFLALSLLGAALPDNALAGDPMPAQETVNINTADAQALADSLVGVGLSRAQEIVRYRETYGPFTTVDELVEVKGVGPATLDRNRARITLE